MTAVGTSGYAARWGDLESKFYSFLARHDRIGETAQQHIFAGYAEHFIAGQKVLDVGSGFGEFLDLLKDRGVIGFGVDVDQGMIRESRARGHTIFVSDALTFLRETRRRFDGVFMGNFVEHFSSEDVLALVKGAHRVLRPGGRVVVATPDPRSMHVHLHEFWRDATHVRLYDRDLLAFMMEMSGFRIVAIGSNDATAYDPGAEWFGVGFADQLTALNEQFVPSNDQATKREGGSMQVVGQTASQTATNHRGGSTTIDPIDLRVTRLSQTLERTRREIARTTDALRAELGLVRAAMAAQGGSGRSRGDAQSPGADPDVPDVSDRGEDVVHEDGPIPPMPIIGERRSAVALRRWRADGAASGHAMFPPPDQRPALPTGEGMMPSVTLALLRDVLDEARLCAAALLEHETTIANLDARLNGLGAVVALAQQEMAQGGRAVRQRLHDIAQGMEDLHRARAEAAGKINAWLHDINQAMEDLRHARAEDAGRIDERLDDLDRVLNDLHRARAEDAGRIDERLDDLDRVLNDLHRARAEDAGRIAGALARLASESQARLAMMQAMREQMASLFSHLYPPREYYVVAVREVEDTGRGTAVPR